VHRRYIRCWVHYVEKANLNHSKADVSITTAIYTPEFDHLCGLVVRVPGYTCRSPGSILGAIRFSEE
jgi:hypothetical protein